MSDRFSLEPYCLNCGTNLHELDKNTPMLMMAVGESIDLKCPKCGIMWRFWYELVTRQRKIVTKRNRKATKKAKV